MAKVYKAPWIVKAYGNIYRVVNLETGWQLATRPVFKEINKVGEPKLFETTSYSCAEEKCNIMNGHVEVISLRKGA